MRQVHDDTGRWWVHLLVTVLKHFLKIMDKYFGLCFMEVTAYLLQIVSIQIKFKSDDIRILSTNHMTNPLSMINNSN
jgi:serine phosphatase RsbU (regulator of sigma subunit)